MTPNVLADNAYEILGLPRGADTPMIRQAFRNLALKHHPDAVPPDQKEQAGLVFARINQAHELLRDGEKRRRYDALLDRGITPDLSREVGDIGGFASLADILGRIESLQIDVDQQRLPQNLLYKMPREFGDLLLSSLIRSPDMHERVLDAVRLTGLQTRNYELPPGKKVLDDYAASGLKLVPPSTTKWTEAWVVVTDLRIIVLMEFAHSYEVRSIGAIGSVIDAVVGGRQVDARYWRGHSFPYLSLTGMCVREKGRFFKEYALFLRDEDDTAFTVWLDQPRLTRLFLVANAYRLPLTIQAAASRGAEYAWALAVSLLLLLLWCVPVLLSVVAGRFCGPEDNRPCTPDMVLWWLADNGLTAGAVYLSAFLLTALSLRVHLAWHVGRPTDIFGELAEDFTTGTGGDAFADRPPEAPAAAAERPRIAPPPPMTPVAESSREKDTAGPPLDVDVPEAVREAMGLSSAEAPAREPPVDAKVSVFCPHCGKEYRVVPGWKGDVHCGQCGQPFDIET